MSVCGCSLLPCSDGVIPKESEIPLDAEEIKKRDSYTRLKKLHKIKTELAELEEHKLENGRLVRLLEEDIHKLQLQLSLQTNPGVYQRRRASEACLWLASDPELFKVLLSSPLSQPFVELDMTCENSPKEAIQWSDLSIKSPVVEKQPKKKRLTSYPCTVRTEGDNESVTHRLLGPIKESSESISSIDIVDKMLREAEAREAKELQSKELLRVQGGVKAVEYNSSTELIDSYSSSTRKKHVQVTHSRNVNNAFFTHSLYHCTVHIPGGKLISVEKRYSDFVGLRESLGKNFAHLKGNLPDFPEKKVVGKLKEDFIKQRQMGLEYFMNEIYMGPLGDSETNTFIEEWVTR